MAKPKGAKEHAKLAGLLAKNTPVCEALKEAGYTQASANKGWAAVPDSVLALMPQQGKQLVELGKIDKDARRNLVRGRLISNVIEGKDGGAMSAKILGSDSELNMWTPDTQVGLIILNAPQSVVDNKAAMLGEEQAQWWAIRTFIVGLVPHALPVLSTFFAEAAVLIVVFPPLESFISQRSTIDASRIGVRPIGIVSVMKWSVILCFVLLFIAVWFKEIASRLSVDEKD